MVFRLLARWWWLILLTVIAAEGAALYTIYTSPPSYRTSVKLQIVASGPREVPLFGQIRTQVTRDEIFYVGKNFIEILKSDAIAQRVVEELGLRVRSSEILKKMTVSPIANTDFVYVFLDWPDPEEGPLILAAQVRAAQKYFALARAKPASSTRRFISQQLVAVRQELEQAKAKFGKFKSDHGIASMDREIRSLESVVTSLRLEKDRALANGELGVAAAFDRALAQRSSQLTNLIGIGFEYYNLEAAVKRAEADYNFLLEKESEAMLKENESLSVEFIQLLEDARAPATLVPLRIKEIAALAGVGGLLLGSLLALALGSKGTVRSNSKEAVMLEGMQRGTVDISIGTKRFPEDPSVSSPVPSQHRS
jgi:uncharacterized protein involved in exopolysaccharide biosynthesis